MPVFLWSRVIKLFPSLNLKFLNNFFAKYALLGDFRRVTNSYFQNVCHVLESTETIKFLSYYEFDVIFIYFELTEKKLAQIILSWFNFDHWWTIFSCYEKTMKCISYTLIAIRLNSRGGQSTVRGPNPARDLNPTHGPNSALQDLLFDVAFETQACYSLCKNVIFYSCCLKRMARRALKN